MLVYIYIQILNLYSTFSVSLHGIALSPFPETVRVGTLESRLLVLVSVAIIGF